MKLLVTGLCISRNLGGPAMALTLVEQLKKRIHDSDFVFAVNPDAFEQEKLWADYYGVEVVRCDTFISYFLNTNPFIKGAKHLYRAIRRKEITVKDTRKRKEIHREFMEAYENCDAVINMMGISYVGDNVADLYQGPSCYSNLYYAEKHKKPFCHFIQSFGPFDDWKVRFFAQRDFKKVPFVPARGEMSAKLCKAIVHDPQKVLDFPDCAILLSRADERWTTDYLQKLELTEKNFVVLSPSSVIYNMRENLGGGVGENHVKTFLIIAKKLLEDHERLLFLPHMYSDNKRECDREICRKVLDSLKKDEASARCRIVEDDLDVWQAKALIAKAKYAIVSRYHALVAAISTGVPVVSVGWNIKYYDLLKYYGMQHMALDARLHTPEQIAEEVFIRLNEYRNKDYSEMLLQKHDENVERVEFAFDLLCKWLQNNQYGVNHI
jgi:polysaccharide pyruvyl transferase WcaK-like protein